MYHQMMIGWRRSYTNPMVPVTTSPLTSGESLWQSTDPLHTVTVFLEKLYSIPEMRGFNLYDLAYVKKGEHANFLLDRGSPVLFVYPPWKDPEDSPARWYQRNQHTIDDLLERYPGLFVLQKSTPIVGGSRKKRVRKRQVSKIRNKSRHRKTKRGKRKQRQRTIARKLKE